METDGKMERQMLFVDQTYVSVARKSEIMHHERTVSQLERKIQQFTKALAWEQQQHHSRLLELERIEISINPAPKEIKEAPIIHHTMKPVTASIPKWTQVRKHTRRHMAPSKLQKAG